MSVKQNNVSISNIYKSRNIMLNVFKRRGFDITDHEDRSIVEIQSMANAKPPQLDMLLKKNNGEKKCWIKYHLTGKIRPNQIYEYVEDLFYNEEILDKQDDLIIVVKENPNDTLIKLMIDLWNNDDVFVTIYNIHNYLYNSQLNYIYL